ncbi:hypothetical protein N7481_009046 [Penicillium waksmanii]|uniref:uncharacterized protein n=1 Tax=Penicillium waksmanii TaxID=69791 RepID=UPI0025479A10|nr:uncharacterized protein N7481_009046 [Penicillium waksmanii]KAJ5975339.1 hypothetical protein N7481_009046 [Penicillium waksmanii]
MYICSERLTLEGQQLICLEKPLESDIEEDKALRAIEEDTAPISEDKEIKESENLEGIFELEELY